MMNDIGSMNLNDWLVLLENRHVNEIQLGLERVQIVASRLNLCHLDACVITVAGTNGKGSTVAMLDAIYRAAGFQVGCYTSPHLLRFNERICVNQVPIADKDLCDAFKIIEQARGDVHLTYFEMTTLAALYYFKQCPLDIVILEVGMGGRLDATNIISATLAVITTIDWDHKEYLGETLEAIGYEKAGILRPNQLFVYADHNPPESIVKKANDLGVKAYYLGKDYSFQVVNNTFDIVFNNQQTLSLPCPLLHLNAAVCAVVVSQLLDFMRPVKPNHVIGAMKTVYLPGRLQEVVSNGITTLFDVAHNSQAVLRLVQWIRSQTHTGRIYAVFSALKDKDLQGLTAPLLEYVAAWYLAPLPSKRAASLSQLLACIGTGSVVNCCDDPVKAYREVMHKVNTNDIIIVYGSFLTVSAVMLADEIGQDRRNDSEIYAG